MSADLKDHFLSTPMSNSEYMRVPYNHIPQDIKVKYNLDSIVTTDNYIYIKINKGMFGLKHAAILAYQHIKNTLSPQGYHPVIRTTALWKHETRPIYFLSLCR